MRRHIEVLHLDGCGGCQLAFLTEEKFITDLFGRVSYGGDGHEKSTSIGIIFGYITEEELMCNSTTYKFLLICGACANSSLQRIREKETNLPTNVYEVKGCPTAIDELIDTLRCLEDGTEPVQKSYPVCKECKERENVCLLLEGKKCHGTVTRGGCKAKCTSIGVACRGCRERLPGANEGLLQKLFRKYEREEVSCE